MLRSTNAMYSSNQRIIYILCANKMMMNVCTSPNKSFAEIMVIMHIFHITILSKWLKEI